MSSDIIIKSLSNDQVLNDKIKSNIPYDYTNYMCVFENASYEIPPEYLGPLYRMSSSFDERKMICEEKSRNAGAEGGLYILRDDWLDPTKDTVCGIFSLDNIRQKTDKGDLRQFTSKRTCDIYNTPRPDPKNISNLIVSKLVPREVINPVTDYDKNVLVDDTKSLEVRDNFMITMITLAIIFYLFYVLKFQVNRPYELYDVTKRLFINRILYVIIIFGLFIYFMCPYGTCLHESFTPNWRKNPDSDTYNTLCNNLKNFRGKRSNEVTNICDNLLDVYGNSLNICNKLLNTINDNSNRAKYYSIYKEMQGCYGCLVSNPCIERQSHHLINFNKLEDGTYQKKCTICDEIFCNGNKCYPGKKSYYIDICPKNIIVEHDMHPKEYNKDKILMECQYCKQTCEIIN